jgi:threonine-phosphate decarboxylase
MAVISHGGNIFAIAQARGWDWRDVADFSASINPLGPAAGVGPAICQALERICHYPEREPVGLRRALAAEWGVAEEQVLLGNGATELIFFVARMLQGMQVTFGVPVFSEFQRAFPGAARVGLEEPKRWPTKGLLILTRPANPTGWSVSLDVLDRHLFKVKDPVLVDESFLEFTGGRSAAVLLERHPQLQVLRSLTKFYALPGLRIGALLVHADRVDKWREQREPWQVNVLAEAAALAALKDKEHAARSVEFVRSERGWLEEQIREVPGTDPLPSEANFLYVRLRYAAERLCQHLLERKILARNCADWPGLSGEAVRVAVKTRAENERLLQAWREFR